MKIQKVSAETIKQLNHERQAKGVTRKALALKAGMSEMTLNNAFGGTRKLQVDEYHSICEALEACANEPEYIIPQQIAELKQELAAKGVTQKWLAFKMETKEQVIYKMLNGIRRMKAAEYQAICEAVKAHANEPKDAPSIPSERQSREFTIETDENTRRKAPQPEDIEETEIILFDFGIREKIPPFQYLSELLKWRRNAINAHLCAA
jgi:transcriptional regulator with XRE-family HTH domain